MSLGWRRHTAFPHVRALSTVPLRTARSACGESLLLRNMTGARRPAASRCILAIPCADCVGCASSALRVRFFSRHVASRWASPSPPRSRRQCREGNRRSNRQHVHVDHRRRIERSHGHRASGAPPAGRRCGLVGAPPRWSPCQRFPRGVCGVGHPPQRRGRRLQVPSAGSWRFRGRDQQRADRPFAYASRGG